MSKEGMVEGFSLVTALMQSNTRKKSAKLSLQLLNVLIEANIMDVLVIKVMYLSVSDLLQTGAGTLGSQHKKKYILVYYPDYKNSAACFPDISKKPKPFKCWCCQSISQHRSVPAIKYLLTEGCAKVTVIKMLK